MKALFLALILLFVQDSAVKSLGDGFEYKTRPYKGQTAVLVKFPAQFLANGPSYLDGIKIALERAGDCKNPTHVGVDESKGVKGFIVKCDNRSNIVAYPVYETSESDVLVGIAFVKEK